MNCTGLKKYLNKPRKRPYDKWKNCGGNPKPRLCWSCGDLHSAFPVDAAPPRSCSTMRHPCTSGPSAVPKTEGPPLSCPCRWRDDQAR